MHSNEERPSLLQPLMGKFQYEATKRPPGSINATTSRKTFIFNIAFILILWFCLSVIWPSTLTQWAHVPTNSNLHPPQSSNYSNAVEWDGYSLSILGQRVFLWGGEFHPWRLPVVELWPDILQKMKGAGMNSVSIYVHWGLSNPSPGVFDFDGYRSLEVFFQMAMQVGLWVVLRPGPYINAETTAGGIPHWVTSKISSHLRTNETAYREAWEPYIKQVSEIARMYQVTYGGPIIAVQLENEFVDRDTEIYKGRADMMQQLKDVMVQQGIVVPLTINDAYMGRNFVKGPGSGDIYGFDSYPQSFDCANPTRWKDVVTEYHPFHMDTNPGQPLYIPEFQGGAFDAWGPNAPGYAACKQLTGPEFESVFNLNLWANNAKMVNIYMIYGGTSWGHIPFPGVYTSYDYGAAISENRDISSSKFAELKRQGLFLRSMPEFYKTDVVANSTHHKRIAPHLVETPVRTGDQVDIDNPNVFGTLLRNPDTGAAFYIVRSLNSTSMDEQRFRITIPLGSKHEKSLSIPLYGSSVQLAGRQSKVITANVKFGASFQRSGQSVNGLPQTWTSSLLRSRLPTVPSDNPSGSTLLYSTASVLYTGHFNGKDVLLLYGDSEQEHEFAFVPRGKVIGTISRLQNQKRHYRTRTQPSHPTGGQDERNLVRSIVNILPGFTGVLPIWESSEQLILFADTEAAGEFWAPDLQFTDSTSFDSPDISHHFKNFWSIGTNASMLVSGPQFVRSATYSTKDRILDLRGDLAVDKDTYLTVMGAPDRVREIRWNGEVITPMVDKSLAGSKMVTYYRPQPRLLEKHTAKAFNLPPLTDWLYTDSLPEIQSGFNDSEWITADHKETNLPYKPKFGERVLYGCDYGFCEGIVIWRGHFNASGDETSVRLAINGGKAFAASVFVNDVFLNTTYGNSSNNKNSIEETDEIYYLPTDALNIGEDNVVTVVQDNMGLDETHNKWDTDGPRSPRGIRGYSLNGGQFEYWKVQGKRGGYTSYPDKLRGIFNEGGLMAERQGWHLPQAETLANTSDSGGTWVRREPSQGLPSTARFVAPSSPLGAPYLNITRGGSCGIGFFKITFNLDIPHGYDTMMSFEFTDLDSHSQGGNSHSSPYRAILFVNGWMMGKRVGNLGPQYKFPVHEGILNYRGTNTVAIALWSMSPTASVYPHVRLATDRVYEGGPF